MTDQNNENPNINAGVEFQQKFELYYVSLVFTVLALSIQTSAFKDFYFQYYFEIGAWSLFMISGLASLSRLEWVPIAFKHRGSMEIEEERLNAVKQGIDGRVIEDSGKEWSHGEKIQAKDELEKTMLKRKGIIEKIEKRIILKYHVQRWGFYLGLLLLIISRGLLQFQSMFE